ncbi:uncharacterized protein BDCG_17816 [Blastomyces dermatitidis ER-3]|uniref:Uncharacterized protein n=2 Tax=Blastomyces TaxID=229219 RepID=A0A179U7T6_BLAGS|nr:uncharacterized protein BDBG_16052 [Blastomyces gilchristii SLH14081]XP_045282605.1 uncharacterized protein BDCG_17816 [Blastomyces dermatitidis ER-3]OAT02878.1 hypothetical protein BDCG_17816 [Blastomyces dermatitidis ER-3]OAT03378.1 hypothetical protein BDBG_16052 [Blastomyces gilchristii SLH14081]
MTQRRRKENTLGPDNLEDTAQLSKDRVRQAWLGNMDPNLRRQQLTNQGYLGEVSSTLGLYHGMKETDNPDLGNQWRLLMFFSRFSQISLVLATQNVP